MKPLLFAAIASTVAFTACPTAQRDEEPAIDRYRHLVLPTAELAERSGASLKQLHIGFGVYVRQCGTCHPHVFPDEISGDDWHEVTPSMAWNANLTDREQSALTTYLLAAKTEPSLLEKQLRAMESLSP